MDKAIYDFITVTIAVLLAISALVLFQSSVNTIATTANSTSGSKNIEPTALVEDSLVVDPSLGDDEVRGEDAVSAVRFYQGHEDVEVRVVHNGVSRIYTNSSSFDVSDFGTNQVEFYEHSFSVSVDDVGGKKRVTYISQ